MNSGGRGAFAFSPLPSREICAPTRFWMTCANASPFFFFLFSLLHRLGVAEEGHGRAFLFPSFPFFSHAVPSMSRWTRASAFFVPLFLPFFRLVFLSNRFNVNREVLLFPFFLILKGDLWSHDGVPQSSFFFPHGRPSMREGNRRCVPYFFLFSPGRGATGSPATARAKLGPPPSFPASLW